MSETTVSHALRLLRTAGIVRNRRDGRLIHYRLDDDHVRMLLDLSREHLAHRGGDGVRVMGTTTATATARRAAGRRPAPEAPGHLVRAHPGLLRGRGRRRAPHQLPRPALRRRPHAHRRDRPGHGAGRHPAGQPPRRRDDAGQHTFGLYRLEILAAFVNALLLFGVAIYVLVEAVRRVTGEPEVLGVPMLVVATLGLVVNLVAFALLREGAKESINVEGAYLEVLADTLGSVGVIVAAVLLELFGWTWVDPVVGAAIGLWILPRTWRLGGQAVRILLQAAPPELDLGALAARPRRPRRAWSTSTTSTCGPSPRRWRTPRPTWWSTTAPTAHGVLDQARALLQGDYRIAHATLQVEPADHEGCDELEW